MQRQNDRREEDPCDRSSRWDGQERNDTEVDFTIRVPDSAAEVIEKLAGKGVLGGVPASRLYPDNPSLADLIIVASTEVNTHEDRAAYAKALKEVLA